jgi:hypothetical protein
MRWLIVCTAGGCLLLLGPAGSEAQKGKEKPAEKTPEERNAEVLNDLMTAYRLADMGRSQKAPEAMITAAGMLRRLAAVKLGTIEERPVIEDEKGEKIADQSEGDSRPREITEEANALFDEAAAMGLAANVNLDPLIKLVKERPLPPGYRAVVGGPKRIHRKIGKHRTETFRVHFWAEKPLVIAFRASQPMHIHALRTDYNHVWVDAVTMHIVHTHGLPGGKKGTKAPVTIRVHNPHKRDGMFELFLN